MPKSFSDLGNHYELHLNHRTVSRCYLDHAFGIQFLGGDIDITIKVESPFHYYTGESCFDINPENTKTLAPVLSIFGKEVVAARAYKTGTLNIEFNDSSKLLVPSDPDYEAWGMEANNHEKIICTPGGELVVWSSAPR